MISIIILTKNPGKRIQKVLESVFKQKIKDAFEVTIIDSDTTDGSLNIAEKFNVRMIKISPKDFGHGSTRNYAVSISKGQYLVMLVQDAIPTGENCLFVSRRFMSIWVKDTISWFDLIKKRPLHFLQI